MLAHRLIARLDIKGPSVVKGVQMEGLRVMGKPEELVVNYCNEADELLYIDTVASLYGRNQLGNLLEKSTHHAFVPVTVGGGINSVDEGRRLFDAGADKIAVNTQAIKRPMLIREFADSYGSQAVTVSIQAKRQGASWEAYTDCGRERSGKDAIAWAHEACALGAGELLVTSIDRDGTRQGFDLDLMRHFVDMPVPVIASGGMGALRHLKELFDLGITAAAFASVLHYGKITLREMRNVLGKDYPIRQLAEGDLCHWQRQAGGSKA